MLFREGPIEIFAEGSSQLRHCLFGLVLVSAGIYFSGYILLSSVNNFISSIVLFIQFLL